MSMPSEAKTASNDAAYMVSRSRMSKRNWEIRSPSCISRFRAACAVQAVVGCAVTPRIWTRRAADLHHEQDVEPAQAKGVEVEEVRGPQARCLRAQEGAPTGIRLPRRGADAGPGEDAPDRPRADVVAKLGEFALYPAMSPTWVLSRQS
jgi:hypothetical protein